MGKPPVTAAIRWLRQRGLSFEAREYEHREKGAEFAAAALGWPLEAMAKTLVAVLDPGGPVVCVLPGTVELSLRALAREAGARSARMATTEEAERLSGYRVGGISPMGLRRAMPVWIEPSLLDHERIGVNGGHRGLIVLLPPRALRDALGAREAPLASG